MRLKIKRNTLQRWSRVALCLFGITAMAASLGGVFVNFVRAAEAPVNHALFATSDQCMACHSNTHTANGEETSIGYQWRATMMANSARDPYWHAGIKREIADHPQAKAAIEDICSTCHMPMARFEAHASGGLGVVSSHLDAFNAKPAILPRNTALAMDGVSCTLCHQVRRDNFGMESSFDGGFVIDTTTPPEQRQLFGRFEIDKGRTRVMHSASGFTPTQATHLKEAELCAGCHTLFTHAMDDRGNPAGVLPEQVPYHEWLRSDFARTDTCQSCHMPKASGETQFSSVVGQPRADVSLHQFVGGNAFMLRVLGAYRDELGVVAGADELEASASRIDRQLANRTAALEIAAPRINGDTIEFEINVRNLAGHKLPTAYPSRRVWLHVTVRDSAGALVFESGAPRADGAIFGNDNDENAAAFEPHHTRITAPDQVQIYESVMGDFAGRVTTGLLFGSRYLKDNRLLPRGFAKAGAPDDVAVRGQAVGDSDFDNGGDRVAFSVPRKNQNGPFTVSAELLYQSIGFRWAQNLRNYDTPESARFLRYYGEQAKSITNLLAKAEAPAR